MSMDPNQPSPADNQGQAYGQPGQPGPQQPYGSTPSTPAPYGQPSYGAPAPGTPMPGYGAPYGAFSTAREHPQGTLVLILGILSIVLCQLTGPFAWVMGRKAMQEIDANPTAYSNRGQVQAGMICGIIGTVLLVLLLLYIVFMFVIFGAAAATSR